MDALTAIEARRVALQHDLDGRKTQKERNRLGQFATPTTLASDVLTHARTLLPEDANVRFLDPAFGTGSFYAALTRYFPAERLQKATGIEIDPHYGIAAQELWRNHALEIEIGDFTAMKPPAPRERFNLVVCNPPYVRHHHMGASEKGRLQAATTAACGVRMGGLAGLYCYFLGLAHAWLADDGIAGWLVPSEFMDVNYGGPVKRYLLHEVELLRIHRFDPNELQFGDALVSSAVVWFRKRRPQARHDVEFSYGGTLSHPIHSRLVSVTALQNLRKWTGLAAGGLKETTEGLRLTDFFSIKRGLATGNNRFFILSRAEIESRNLPREFFKPILPGPRYLPADVIEAEADGTPKVERQQFILDCRLPEDQVRARFPSLWAYLKTGKPKVSDTYLCSRRSPWYSQENRPPAPFVCTYMGRGIAKREKPFRFILNRSQATAANVYLMLYPIPALAKAIERVPELARRVWEFLDSIPPEVLLGEGRVYGGGLYKMEPKELANVPADAISALLPASDLRPAKQREMFPERAA
ncbi:MAG: N-6 DNA methylase [Candidatus Binatus sp.]|uniref:Eco57I restriction-modification methylase domain-containing protein n=1 Tax=Candidatus Binatus sp. TaxID=2811406 RepID=UPI00271D6886|nr:N-6 DNA methylase [Candidatus Binatus sp.]MDO8432325.1 N-6 DNA methylase [Candidatus Binatus sp.]